MLIELRTLVIRGENIGCGEVEAALLEHPLIQEASVYAIPDERLGEEVGTTLGVSAAIEEDELSDFLQKRIAKFKIPRHISQQTANRCQERHRGKSSSVICAKKLSG